MYIHPLSDVKSTHIGVNTKIWQFAVVLDRAVIGHNCNINCHTFIENQVIIGNNVTVKSGVYLWDGLTIQDNVFIGPNATFTNDKYPRSKQYPEEFQRTLLEEGCSIGANSTITGGTIIGRYSIIGAGSVVTKNVPPFALVYGNPAKIAGWLDQRGNKLIEIAPGKFTDEQNQYYKVEDNNLIQL